MSRVVTDDDTRAEMRRASDEIALEGARRMLAAALEAEADAYIAGLADELDDAGQPLVVRNGHAEPRTITTAAGRTEVRARLTTQWQAEQRAGRSTGLDDSSPLKVNPHVWSRSMTTMREQVRTGTLPTPTARKLPPVSGKKGTGPQPTRPNPRSPHGHPRPVIRTAT